MRQTKALPAVAGPLNVPSANAEGGHVMTIVRFAIAVAMLLAVAGCGGGGAEVTSTVSGTTLGQELEDLEKARADGLITQDEYEDSREAIMERYDQ